MSGHKHETDKVDGVAIAECPNGCDVSITLDYEDSADNEILTDLKKLMRECQKCGAEMSYIQKEEPVEVLD